MTRPAHALLLMLCAALPLAARAESRLVTDRGSPASAALDFRIIVPPIVRVLGNHHPASLPPPGAAARQELEVLTTLRQGFCAVLRLNTSGVHGWTVRSGDAGVQVQRTGDGFRVCALRNGRHRVALEHRFEFDDAATAAQRPWPVQTELSAL
jgi:hypothetical protein